MAQDPTKPAPTPRKCPTCGSAPALAFHPFCSRRCADADLNRWLNGSYAIPARDEDETDQGSSEAG